MVRHAQSIWHDENKYAGITDIGITELGLKQSQNLASWAGKQAIGAIWTSDRIRAIQTATPSSKVLELALITNSKFSEVNFGKVEGLNPIEFAEKFPLIENIFQKTPADTELPFGESGRIASVRAMEGLSEISKSGCKEALLVSHGTILRLMFCDLMGIDLNNYRRVFPSVKNTAINSFMLPDNSSPDELRGNGRLEIYNSPIY